MKNNIHIISTDKPSRLYLGNNGNFVFGMIQTSIQSTNDDFTNQSIYITSDEEIKKGDWTLNSIGELNKYKGGVSFTTWKKVILSTDQDLIADGIQDIDNEFLKWFVKNPSCEEVEFTRPNKCKVVGCDLECILFKTCENIYIGYKINIPKSEN